MCDVIGLPDKIIENHIVNGEKRCLCDATQEEIFRLIGLNLPPLDYDTRVVIEMEAGFGFNVTIERI
jgi:hypothetical protein